MKSYKIQVKTDPYNAQRNAMFNGGNTTAIIESGLTLKEAYKWLLNKYNECAEHWQPNWGMAVLHSEGITCQANKTFSDGTRSLCCDVYTYSIICEQDEEL